jgi:hypothetical protein
MGVIQEFKVVQWFQSFFVGESVGFTVASRMNNSTVLQDDSGVPMSQNILVICTMKKRYKIYETYSSVVKLTCWPVICSISAKVSSREKHKDSPSTPPMSINTGLPK